MSEYIVRVDGQMPDAIYERELTKIVRCRDCWHYYDGSCYADQWSTASLMPPHRVTPYGFCAWGVRSQS